MNILDHPGSAFSSMGRSLENSLTSTLELNLTLGDSRVARAPAMAILVASRSLLVPVVVCLLQAPEAEEPYLLFRRMERGVERLKAVSDLTTRGLLGRR